MGKAEDRPVYQCMYRLLMLILDARDKFPKNYRYEFGTELMNEYIAPEFLLQVFQHLDSFFQAFRVAWNT